MVLYKKATAASLAVLAHHGISNPDKKVAEQGRVTTDETAKNCLIRRFELDRFFDCHGA
jgi:hypothetical protein